MIYGHQIKQADAFITNLDIGISRLVWNGNLTKNNKMRGLTIVVF